MKSSLKKRAHHLICFVKDHMLEKLFVVTYSCVVLSVSLGQSPTEEAKSRFEDKIADFILDENAVTRYCVLMEVTASTSVNGENELIETSKGFLAVDKEKKCVRYDFDGDVVGENGSVSLSSFRHLQLDKDFYWGEGDDIVYRVVKLNRNMLVHGDGRLVNPMMLPFAGSLASKSTAGQATIFGGARALLDPEDISAAWFDGDKVIGVVGGRTDCSRVFVFDEKQHGVVDARLFIHPKNLFVNVPSKKFSPSVITKTKWKELPTLGWRPIEAEDVSDQGPSTSRSRKNILTKVRWITEEFPDGVFESKDLETKLGKKSALQKLFD